MEDFANDVAAESSPAGSQSEPSSQGTSTPDPAQAGAQQQQQPFHTHPRFRALIEENRGLKATVGSLNQRLGQLESLSARAQAQGGMTQEEAAQYREAATALKKIIQNDPELAQLLQLREHLPQLRQGYESVQQLGRAQAQAQMTSARNHIRDMAAKEGLPTDQKYLTHLVRLVAAEAMQLPDGNERYDRGDMSVLEEAFASIKGSFLGTLRREATAGVAQTKDKLKKMPPAPRGGAAGPEAPKAPAAGEERKFTSDMHKRGLALLRERLNG